MNIAVLTSCESESHLSEPIIKEIENLDMSPYRVHLTQNDIIDSYHKADFCFRSYKYDFVLAVADRPEQMGGVLAAFHNKIPIGHLYAGDLNTIISTFDDKHRHAITLYSDIQFCSCTESVNNVVNLMRASGLVPNANYVGATHFDNINLNEIKSNTYGFKELMPYILILINSETLGNDDLLIKQSVDKCRKICEYHWKECLPSPHIIIAKGNGDKEAIETSLFTGIMKHTYKTIDIVRDNRHDHKFFLSLIAHCSYFITNSSSVIYEAPLLIEESKIIQVGKRNKGRTKIPKESHNGKASNYVAKLIKAFLETKC